MSNEASGTDLSAGQAVPSLNSRGNDEFSALLAGDGAGSGQQGTKVVETTKVAGGQEKPDLTQTTLQKPAGTGEGNQTQSQGQQTQSQGQQTQSQGQQNSAQPGAIDKSVLDQIVETATRTASSVRDQQTTAAAGAQVKQDQKELTAEEFNAKYNIQPITEAHIQAILDADPKKGAAMLNSILVRNMGSAVLMAKDIVERQLATVRDEMSPHVSSWQTFQKEQREAKLEADFYSANKDLVNEKPLVKEMQDAIFGRIASGQLKPFARPEDALKAVADSARAVLARMNKQAATTGGTAQQQSQQQSQGQGSSSRQMTAASTAGQSGAGSAAKQSDEEAIFGKDYV